MTEDDARAWIDARFGTASVDRVAAFLMMVAAENEHQNLVSPSTLPQLWSRHAVDSAQLVSWARPGLWIDIGTGGGFPGMIVALLRPEPVLMVEPRRRRALFLGQCIDALRLDRARVTVAKIEQVEEGADVISARAVASIENLLHMAARCAKRETRWLLPRGRLIDADVMALRHNWHGVFHVEQSLTDSESSILVLDGPIVS